MVANFAKLVARDDEFCNSVGKYKVREKGRVRIRVRVRIMVSLLVAASCTVMLPVIKRCVDCNACIICTT